MIFFFFVFKINCRSLCFCRPERRGICWESTGTLLSNKEGIFTVSKSAGSKIFFPPRFHTFVNRLS